MSFYLVHIRGVGGSDPNIDRLFTMCSRKITDRILLGHPIEQISYYNSNHLSYSIVGFETMNVSISIKVTIMGFLACSCSHSFVKY